ncbi:MULTISPECIES: hypothetical protein [Streptomyces]|uniref:Uncharacterized protein n=1 Tax=Streptomyces qinglanensis TaxID=943816 RepID=A0A1E7K079_9ACTN|nr:hypothetical protein [Streptomyces qinglanensis]MBE9498641.1 hypothetical protein [Streptomyces sp. GKU 257-1]OEU97343.1 hypothetical protein AN217_05040 [Streptomyces qinglanensis]OEV25867.1 hypothetical protein AN220_11545 [Streptomyces nanshensis]OEV25870.1 hypothetical protein AN220_11560 [Streptomyces nanshensis]
MSVDPHSSDRPGSPREAAASLVFDDPLTRPSADDTDRGWGEGAGSGSAGAGADLARFLDEKPPHHL